MDGQNAISIRPFTREEDDILRESYRVKTVRELAKILNRSRNSIIGRASRLGVNRSKSEAALEREVKRRHDTASIKDHLVVKRSNSSHFRKSSVRLSPQELPEETVTPLNGVGVKIWDLEPGHCRWVMGETKELTFCGHQKKFGSHYCNQHHDKSVVKK